jgi:DNA-binding GntR family transcriptional regulator
MSAVRPKTPAQTQHGRVAAAIPRRAPDTLGVRVYQELRDAIVSLRIPPGVPLSEGHVSRHFGGSRTPVRAALSRLEREGLLETTSHGTKVRYIVPPLTASDMRQLFLMVGALNAVAARLAAELAAARRRALVKQLKTINEDLRGVAGDAASDVRRVEEIDARFHRAYEVVVSAPQLVLELETLAARRTRYIRVYTEALIHAHNMRESVTEHDGIIEAVAAGDADAAERSAGFHYRQALCRFGRALEVRGEQGGWF